jgi:nucleotide-binding universal stress UspA family protein
MFRTIVVPLDGSALSARALPYAQRIARAGGAKLLPVRAHLPMDEDLLLRVQYADESRADRTQRERAMAQSEFSATVDGLRSEGLLVEPHFVEGVAADVIVGTAEEARASLIVMSTHGHGGLGRWLYGSVAHEVLRRVPIPVLLVSAVCSRTWSEGQPLRVLVPLDGSVLATEALIPASDLAASLGGEILLLGVVEPSTAMYVDAPIQATSDLATEEAEAEAYLHKAAADLRAATMVPISIRVVHGDAAATIAKVAREAEADVIAMATHGRGGLARLVLGSVATRTLQQSSVPVLMYRAVAVRQTRIEAGLEMVTATAAPNG